MLFQFNSSGAKPDVWKNFNCMQHSLPSHYSQEPILKYEVHDMEVGFRRTGSWELPCSIVGPAGAPLSSAQSPILADIHMTCPMRALLFLIYHELFRKLHGLRVRKHEPSTLGIPEPRVPWMLFRLSRRTSEVCSRVHMSPERLGSPRVHQN